MSDDEVQRKFDSVADLIHSLAEEHDRQMEDIRHETARIDRALRYAIRLGVREARAERRRRRESGERLDDLITKLAAAQLVTEEKLQGLIESLRGGTNGRS
jgi:hypothetical protein